MNIPSFFKWSNPPSNKQVHVSIPSKPNHTEDDIRFSFVSIAAHELRTPLTSIKGYLSVLISDYGAKMSEDEKGLIKNIETATNELYSLVENLLSVSRVERGAMTIKTAKVDYLGLVKETVDEFKTRASQKNIRLDLIPPSVGIPALGVDQGRIKEVLSNLLSNAIYYTEANGKVLVYVNVRGDDVITSVADNGSGIAPSAMPHLFSEFYRAPKANSTQDPNPQGSGLGLFICKSIIELHKGKIWVESKLGVGSVFSFSLPVYSESGI